jgi:hypothetical protein
MIFTITQGDLLPKLAATLKNTDGSPFNLTGCTVKFIYRPQGGSGAFVKKNASIVGSMTAGTVEYSWDLVDTSVPGSFVGQFEVTLPSASLLTFPNGSYIDFRVAAQLDSAEALPTSVSDFVQPIRSILSDTDPDVPAFDTEQIEDAVRTVLKMGRIPGFTLGNDLDTVSPRLDWRTDPLSYSRVVMHAVRLFVVGITRTSFNTRAFSESIGEPKELVDSVINDVYKLDNGEMSL